MNLILLKEDDFVSPNHAQLSDRRFAHIRDIHQAESNSTLKVGLINGLIGTATVTHIHSTGITLQIQLNQTPPLPLPVTLLLALPRPKMLKRILQTASTMGVKDIYLINSYRVDKSYWSTPLLTEEAIYEQLILGLEQAGDTHLPKVHLRKRFKPFVEDELPSLSQDSRKLVAHPYNAAQCPPAELTKTILAVGPEGGFIPYEIEKLAAAGFTAFHVGQRILRVETAIPALLSRLFPIL